MSNRLTIGQAIAAALAPRRKSLSMAPTTGNGGWLPIIREAGTGFWQRGIEVNASTASTFHTVFACQTLVARDISKLGARLMRRDAGGIWSEVLGDDAIAAVLAQPNSFQTWPQFIEHWILSKLQRGNAYVLKSRDGGRRVAELYVLNPDRVTPLIAEDGSVFYQLATDALSGLPTQVTVPATEVIHDRFNCLFHPLVGVAPIYAAALAATQGLNIQQQSTRLFANHAQPGGILTAPGNIDDADVARIKTEFEQKTLGANFGRTVVLGGGLKFEPVAVTARDSQLIEQLKWSAEVVASVFHVPAYMVGAGPEPATGNAQERTLRYYTQVLQSLIEDAEACLDRGFGIGKLRGLQIELDVDNLLRMDSITQAEIVTKLSGGAIATPDEGRFRFNLPPTPGGNALYRQQQEYSLAALAKRDAREDPFATSPASPAKSATGRTIRPAASGATASAEIESADSRATLPTASPGPETLVVEVKGELNDAMSDHVVAEFKRADGRPVCLIVDSNGGKLATAMHICRLIEDYPSCVTTLARNKANSAAALVVMAGDRRLILEDATMLIHDARHHGKRHEAGSKIAAEAITSYAGWSSSAARGWMAAESVFTAAEANRAHFVDAVATKHWSADDAMPTYPKRPPAKWLADYRRTDAEVERWASEGGER